MFDMFSDLLEEPWIQALLTLVLSIVGAYLLRRLIVRVLAKLAGRTATNLDDIVVAALERPIFYSIILGGIAYSLDLLDPSPRIDRISSASLQTLAIIVWTGAIIRIGTAVLQTMSYHAKPNSVVQARTLPFFVILTKLIVVGTSIYMGMLAWKTDITAWLASAGIVGIAVGFAAKDSLANFFAGIFIIADAPYKLGDFIQFDDGLRGRVTHIGIRSTRILTRDDIEINIPNSIIGNAKIVNETGGPYAKERVAIPVSVAYGSDVDQVREVLLTTPLGVTYVCDHPAPIVFFQNFGASGLEFEVLCWIEDPAYQENVISDVNFRIYKALARAGIEIPYSKHDVYIKSFPELEPLAPQPPPKWVARLQERAAELAAAEATEVETSVGDALVDDDDAAPVDDEATGEEAAGADPAKQFSRVPSPLSSFFRRPLRRRGPKPT